MESSKTWNELRRWGEQRELRWLAVASILSVSLGYLVPQTIVIEPGSGLLAALSVHDFHAAEGAYRWTRARSSLVFPDPPTGLEVRVEAEISGFRPPGRSFPLLVVQSGRTSARVQTARGLQTVALDSVTRGWWRSDHEVVFLSQTFTPSETDRRALGVRVHAVKLIPRGGLLGSALPIGLPPARQLLATTLGLMFAFTLLVRGGLAPRRAFWVGLIAALAWAFAFALARAYAAYFSLAIFWTLSLALFGSVFLPGATRFLGLAAYEVAQAAGRGLRLLAGRCAAGLVMVSVVGVTASYLSRPSLSIDVGSGEATLLAEQFAGLDQARGVKFRRALPGATIDLRDFGGGDEWTVTLTAQLAGPPQQLTLVQAADREIVTVLDSSWSRHTLTAHAPWGWRSGLVLTFPSASYPLDLRIDEIHLRRARSLPSVRVMLLVAGTVLLLLAAGGASGLSAAVAAALAAILLLIELVVLTAQPVLFIPFLPLLLGATVGGLLFAALAAGAFGVLSRLGWTPNLAPDAIAAAAIGFVTWFAITLFPLYQGGHFVYHSSIAEEIWQGRFLTFYLPSPENMLAIQNQWGNLVIPHSCLYHTVVSPLAMLPHQWFYALEKAVLAGMLASMSLAAAVLATRLRTARAGVLAAIMTVGALPTFQLLELGHLMTLFGCWAATLALTYLVLRFEHLPDRRTWWGATALLTLCFLSYTASLLFTATVVSLAVLALFRSNPRQSKALATAALVAAVSAFFLYYIHWAAPFLKESLPHILATASSTAEGPTLWNRIAGLPRKLSFTYGHPLLPLAGLFGLGLLGRSPARLLLFLWGGILILFSGIDLFFNLLLKHHYFVVVPVSIGLGVLASWLGTKGRLGGILALVFVVFFLVAGGAAAVLVAMGRP